MQAIGAQWQQVFDIDVSFESLSWSNYLDRLRKHEYLVGGSSWCAWYIDPLFYLERFTSRYNGINYTQWEDAQFTNIVETAKQQTDPAQRTDYFRQAEAYILREMPIIPVYYYHYRYMHHQHLKDVLLSETGQIDFKWSYFES
jgi:oligopeptide transport system substrate-binding protein